MPAVNGTGGSITFPSGWAIHVQGWAAVISHEVDDVTAINSVYPDRDSVMVDWQGVAVGKIESASLTAPANMYGATPAHSNAKGTITLTTKTGKTWTGTALITTLSMERNRLTTEVSVSFVAAGSITEAHA